MTRSLGREILPFAVLLFIAASLQAQSSIVSPGGSSGWQRVQQLPAHTAVDIRKDKGKVLCLIDSVGQDELTCSTAKASSPVHLSREEIKSIRLQNKGRSAGIGLVIGAGIGAGAGAGIGAAVHGSSHQSFDIITQKDMAGIGAAIGGIIGGVTGALIGHSRDDFGTLVYRR